MYSSIHMPGILPSYQKCHKIVAPARCGLFPLPQNLYEEKSYPIAKNLLIYPSEKPPLIYLNLSQSKVHFFPIKQQFSSNHPMQSSFVAAVISYWMLPLAWQKHWMIEALPPSKMSIPSILPFPPSLQSYFENPASIIACFPLFHTPFFISNFMKFQLTSLQVGICGYVGSSNITDSKLVGINQTKLKK